MTPVAIHRVTSHRMVRFTTIWLSCILASMVVEVLMHQQFTHESAPVAPVLHPPRPLQPLRFDGCDDVVYIDPDGRVGYAGSRPMERLRIEQTIPPSGARFFCSPMPRVLP